MSENRHAMNNRKFVVDYATRRELARMLCGAMIDADGEGLTDDEVERISAWEHEAATTAVLLTEVRAGNFYVRWPEGAEAPIFGKLTDKQQIDINERTMIVPDQVET